jgi:hypothetical protein
MPFECSAVEGRALLVILCIDGCSCFHERATDFSMPFECSEVEGRGLLAIPDINILSARH